jgi:hypothetical protein
MSPRRSLDLLCINSLTSPRLLPPFADSARLAQRTPNCGE